MTIYDPSWKYGPPPTPDCERCGGALNDDNDCYDCGKHRITAAEWRDAKGDYDMDRARDA